MSTSRKQVDEVVIRFAGDSGDGMQLTGSNFTEATALYGNDLATFPDFPAEIRAPAGATFGVSAFQIYFGSQDVTTAGDDVDVLVAMNPAALITNLKDHLFRSFNSFSYNRLILRFFYLVLGKVFRG